MSRCPGLRALLLLCLATAACSAVVHAQPAQASADTATTAMPATDLPYSGFASDAAKAKFAELLAEVRAGKAPNPTDIADQRQFYQRYNDARLQEVQRRYPAKVSEQTLAGVAVHSVEPAGGIAAAQRQRVLINLHGGAFMWGAGSGALVEAIPIAAVAGIAVVAPSAGACAGCACTPALVAAVARLSSRTARTLGHLLMALPRS